MPNRRARPDLGLGTAALLIVLAGCSAGDDTRSTAAARPESAATSASSKPSASTRPVTPTGSASSPAELPTTSAEATATATTSPSNVPVVAGNKTLADRLLTAAEMPGVNEGLTWREVRTREHEGNQPFGTCHKFAMTSIGAVRVVVREYAPNGAGEETASHLVAEFADQETARRAFEVLKSWRGQCEDELSDHDRRDVGGFRTVNADGADAGWYLLVYGPPDGGSNDQAYFDAQGVTLVGKRVSALQMRTVAQDDHQAGKDPMVQAVRAASAQLG